MIKRSITEKLFESISNFPVTAIVGPRQAGKTTLVKSLFKDHEQTVYIDLELPSDKLKLTDPEIYLQLHTEKLVIIDEVQEMPDLFPLLRALIDKNRSNGRFLLLGSTSGKIIQNTSESLAGRINFIELTPFHLMEIGPDLNLHWWRGGFPLAHTAASDKKARNWLNAFIKTFIERDLSYLNSKITPSRMLRLLQMIAHCHGNILNRSELARSLEISPTALSYYIDVLDDAMLVRRLQPYFINIKKRLVKSPKIYIRDSGILHGLHNIPDQDSIFGHPKLGASWEGYVIEQIAAVLPAEANLHYYRTHKNAEVDLIISYGNQIQNIVEIKFGLSPKLSKGFYSAFKDLKTPKTTIIYSGQDSYPLNENISVSSLQGFLQGLSGG